MSKPRTSIYTLAGDRGRSHVSFELFDVTKADTVEADNNDSRYTEPKHSSANGFERK